MENIIKSSVREQAEKNEKCYKICAQKIEKHREKKVITCSNKGQTYENLCHVSCDVHFVDPTIRVRYKGRCDDPNKSEIYGYESDPDWMDKL